MSIENNMELEHGNAEHDHVMSYKFLSGILLALLCLTALTVYAAQFHFGAWNTAIALAIASSKGSLVAAFFMHLKYENRAVLWTFLVTLLMLAIFIGMTFADISVRYHH